jgi:hypothetical protein
VAASGDEFAVRIGFGPEPPDLAIVDVLARLQLDARRAGGSIRLTDVRADLADLLELVGLRREVGGETERREQLLGVEERMEPGDPVA